MAKRRKKKSPVDTRSPGQRLLQARKSAGLDIRQVAEALKLLPYQITAIENDELNHFNGPLFYRAHLKSYASLLKLDSAQLLDLYQKLLDEQRSRHTEPEQATPTKQVTPIQRPKRGSSFPYWSAAAVVVLSFTLWVSQSENDREGVAFSEAIDSNDQSSLLGLERRASADAKILEAAQTQRADGQLLPVAGMQLSQLSSSQPQAERSSVSLINQPVFNDNNSASVVIDLPATTTVSDSAMDQVAQGDDALSFSFSADCWVEVSDGYGRVIHASLKQADDTLKLTGAGPFKVLLGYAHGVSLAYNGEPVAIQVKNRNNSARLVVGNIPVQ